MFIVQSLYCGSAPLGAACIAPKGAGISLPIRCYKHFAPTVLVLKAILTVSPDLQQHAASHRQGVILLLRA